MSEVDSVADKLYGKLERFGHVSMFDENNKPTISPRDARFFNFDYTIDGEVMAHVTASLIDPSELRFVYSQHALEKMDPQYKKQWYRFLEDMRKFSMRNLIGWAPQLITKKRLETADMDFMARYQLDKNRISESRVTWQRRGKVSEGHLNGVRIHVIHNESGLENPGNRLSKVDRIFLENGSKERFLLPFKSVLGAKAMAHHVNRGGTPYDTHGQVITKAVQEMRNLMRFQSATRTRTFENENSGRVIEASKVVKENIRVHLRRLLNNRRFDESMGALAGMMGISVAENNIRDWFVEQNYSDKLDEVMGSAAWAWQTFQEQKMTTLRENADMVMSKLKDPDFKIILRKDPGADSMLASGKFADARALLSAIMGDIADRLITPDADEIANFASMIGDEISSEGEAFGRESNDPEYKEDKQAALQLARRYMDDLKKMKSQPGYEDEVRMDPEDLKPKKHIKRRNESEQFESDIAAIGSVTEMLQADDGEHYSNPADFFGKFEPDTFDHEEESADGMEIRGFVDNKQVMAFRYDDHRKKSGWGNYDDRILDMADESRMDEEPNEGNEFSGALAAAKAAGKEDFEVDGKTYPVKEADEDEAMEGSLKRDRMKALRKTMKRRRMEADGESTMESLKLMRRLAGLSENEVIAKDVIVEGDSEEVITTPKGEIVLVQREYDVDEDEDLQRTQVYAPQGMSIEDVTTALRTKFPNAEVYDSDVEPEDRDTPGNDYNYLTMLPMFDGDYEMESLKVIRKLAGLNENYVYAQEDGDEAPHEPKVINMADVEGEFDCNVGDTLENTHYGTVKVVEITDTDIYGLPAEMKVQKEDGEEMTASVDQLLGYEAEESMGEASKEAKPDFLDLDKDGNKTEPMKKAAADAEKMESRELDSLKLIKKLAGI
jgi:hypothetical protein